MSHASGSIPTPPSAWLDASVMFTRSSALSPPVGSIIYVFSHIYLHLVYVGVTMSALVTRLRKHMADATSFRDCSTLHRLMLQVDMGGWGILPSNWSATPG